MTGWLLQIVQALIIGTVATVAVAVLQRQRWLARWSAMAPARKAARDGRRAQYRAVRDTLVSLDRPATGAAFWERLPTVRHLRVFDLKPPLDEVLDILRPLTQPGAHGLLATLLYPEAVREVRDEAARAIASGEVFARMHASTSINTSQLAFGQWVTAAIGTPILADGLDSRSRVGSDVRVWSSAEYVGQGRSSTTYEQVHQGRCPAWQRLASRTGHQPPRAGDYDGRVLVVESCATFEDLATGDLVFALTTSESCYASTEEGRDMPWGCKHLPVLSPAHDGDTYTPDLSLRQLACVEVAGAVQPMLTSFIALLTADQKLVLCTRSGAVNTGLHVLSATAGGVHEPGDSCNRPLDRDVHGWPDPAISAVRELQEELGVDVPRASVRPACVFLANSRNDTNDDGQLVVCVLYLARTEADFDQVLRSLWSSSDLAKGRFEVDQLVPLDVAELSSFATAVEAHVERMDQHGLLSTVYVSKLLWGEGPTRELFEPLLDRVTLPRLVHPAPALMPDRYRPA